MIRGTSFLWVLYAIWIKAGLRAFYGKISTHGKKRMYGKTPILLAPNHQNAFMDAIAVAAPISFHKPISFMVRQDAFDNKIAGAILRTMKLFPAYRMRDGYENLGKNKESFDHCNRLLEDGQGVLVFPEADHGIPRKLRPFKKGLMRMAFQAEQKNDFNLGLKIVPVGINYMYPHEAGGTVLIIFGDPIDVVDYKERYEGNPAKAQNSLKSDVYDVVKPLVIHIENDEFYDEIESIRWILLNNDIGHKTDLKTQFDFHKKSIDKVEAWIDKHPENQLKELVTQYESLKKETNLRDWILTKKKFGFSTILMRLLDLLLLLPAFLISFPISYFPFTFPNKLALKKIKDPGFRSSINFGLALVAFSVIYLIITIALLFILKPWYLAFLFIPVAFYLGRLAWLFLRLKNKLQAMLRYNKFLKRKDKNLMQLLKLREEISNLFS